MEPEVKYGTGAREKACELEKERVIKVKQAVARPLARARASPATVGVEAEGASDVVHMAL